MKQTKQTTKGVGRGSLPLRRETVQSLSLSVLAQIGGGTSPEPRDVSETWEVLVCQ